MNYPFLFLVSLMLLFIRLPLFLCPLYYGSSPMDLLSLACCVYIPPNPIPIITSFADALPPPIVPPYLAYLLF